jgi:hypothetical protein
LKRTASTIVHMTNMSTNALATSVSCMLVFAVWRDGRRSGKAMCSWSDFFSPRMDEVYVCAAGIARKNEATWRKLQLL